MPSTARRATFSGNGNQLCTALQDTTRNGGRNLDGLLEHIKTEHLVQWAFAPGTRLNGDPRQTPPLSYPDFIAKFTQWVGAGGPCPSQ
jgi:hypothetical protein